MIIYPWLEFCSSGAYNISKLLKYNYSYILNPGLHSISCSFNLVWNHIQDILNCAPATEFKNNKKKKLAYSLRSFRRMLLRSIGTNKKGRKAEMCQIFPITMCNGFTQNKFSWKKSVYIIPLTCYITKPTVSLWCSHFNLGPVKI